MNPVVDITDDHSKRTFLSLTSVIDMPSYVKEAGVETEESVERLPQRAFADVVDRKLPLHTKASTWVSALYLYGSNSNAPLTTIKEAEERLLKHADIWGITADIAAIKSVFTAKVKEAGYAIDFDWQPVRDGPVTRVQRCPCHTEDLAVKSADWLAKNFNAFPLSVLKGAAEKLAIACPSEKMSKEAGQLLDKLCHTGTFTNMNLKVANAIINRLEVTKYIASDGLGQELHKVATSLLKQPYGMLDDAELIAESLEAFDVSHGFNEKWGTQLQHPIDVCFGVTFEKAASALDFIELTTGTSYKLSDLTDRQIETGLKYAGDEVVAYCKPEGLELSREKVAELLPTLPRNDAKNFSLGVTRAGGEAITLDSLIGTL